jgi:hypothetical protein
MPYQANAIAALAGRSLPGGGFPEMIGGDYRPDATAWAILCLESFHCHAGMVADARSKLVENQQPDGRIPLAPDHPEACWPTAVAAMALQGPAYSSAAHDKAVTFLLTTAGQHSSKDPESPVGHDSSIPGWPWIEQTHSWVEPTAMAIRALVLSGKSSHPRVQAGVRLLLDRQLPDGGWNYGNTTIFGKTLNPMPVSTGMALWTLAGQTEREKIATSLALLERQLAGLNTPLSLGWVLLGLAAWNGDTRQADALAASCLQRQDRYGAYGTSQLGVLLTATASLPAAGGSHA